MAETLVPDCSKRANCNLCDNLVYCRTISRHLATINKFGFPDEQKKARAVISNFNPHNPTPTNEEILFISAPITARLDHTNPDSRGFGNGARKVEPKPSLAEVERIWTGRNYGKKRRHI
jgi:hypothetical protein